MGFYRPRGWKGLNRFIRTDGIRQDIEYRQDYEGQREQILQEITTRTSGIILDRAMRTDWVKQDPEDRKGYTDPRGQIGLLVQWIKRTDRIEQEY
jgi:hypothetical protein